jgi:hypothetical protein
MAGNAMTIDIAGADQRSGDWRALAAIMEAARDASDEDVVMMFREILVRACELVARHCDTSIELADRRTIRAQRADQSNRTFTEGTQRAVEVRFWRHGSLLCSITGTAEV